MVISMTEQSLYSIRTASPAILPPKPEDEPGKIKAWQVSNAFRYAGATHIQDAIRKSMEQTAMIENRRAAIARGQPVNQHDTGEFKPDRRQGNKLPGNWYVNFSASCEARTAATNAEILAALTKPMTSVDLAHASGRSKSTVQRAMSTALDKGLVKVTYAQRLQIWERVE